MLLLLLLCCPKSPFLTLGLSIEATLEALRFLYQSRPIFIPGIELARGGLENDFEALLAASGIPFATMMFSKSILSENYKQFIGLYAEDRSRKYVQER